MTLGYLVSERCILFHKQMLVRSLALGSSDVELFPKVDNFVEH